ncbi:MAG TPA: aldo/keto reductase [Tepidisphaeraceae bacterium]|nr:aldo/keto reductase [Tepidisphaeraceae bacterium]
MNKTLNWGILGTGNIAKAFAKHLPHSRTGKLVAVASRSQETADAFAREFGATKPLGSYEAMLTDPDVQAVYVATPHPLHAEWAIRLAEAGKHLLVEKPIGLNAGDAMAIIEAAETHNVFLMEAFMYRCHPQTAKVVELIRQGAIGDVRVIHATFSFHWPKPWNGDSRLTNNALGGGGILDVGCYPISASRLIAGAATGLPFAEPTELKAVAHLGATAVDEWAIASLKFPGDILAQCATGVQLNQENLLRIDGSDGSILVPDPWVPAKDGGKTKIIVRRAGKEPEEIDIEAGPIYAIEADTVAEHIEKRQSPTMSWRDTLGNMRALDRWRKEIGLVYEGEKPGKLPNLAISPTAAPSKMSFGSIAGVDKKISRIVFGCDNQPNFPQAAVMFDHFFSRGGNAFDTAHIYGGGQHEILLGQWIAARGLREQIVIITKGAHTPFCDPRNLTLQLLQSLDRLKTDYVDVYLMHRDNPEIPVGEFIDVLNEHHRAGRIRTFGGSNWSLPRIKEANEYARRHNLVGFGAVSNQFSLARMVNPPWTGCISASDPESIRWLTETKTPLLAWSSQARGFFSPGRAEPNKTEDTELVRCWYAPDNFNRLERVKQLAMQMKTEPINIALAYVLNQPFPTFALIGPRELSETRSSLQAISISLTEEERLWLNLETNNQPK